MLPRDKRNILVSKKKITVDIQPDASETINFAMIIRIKDQLVISELLNRMNSIFNKHQLNENIKIAPDHFHMVMLYVLVRTDQFPQFTTVLKMVRTQFSELDISAKLPSETFEFNQTPVVRIESSQLQDVYNVMNLELENKKIRTSEFKRDVKLFNISSNLESKYVTECDSNIVNFSLKLATALELVHKNSNGEIVKLSMDDLERIAEAVKINSSATTSQTGLWAGNRPAANNRTPLVAREKDVSDMIADEIKEFFSSCNIL